MSTLSVSPKLSAVPALNTLRRCPFLGGLSSADLESLAEMCVPRTFGKGEYLFHEGTPVHGLYIVRRGAVKLHRVNWLGKEQFLHIFRPVESFAEESLFSRTGHTADACALEGTEILLVRQAELMGLLKRRPELALCLLRSMDRYQETLMKLLDDLTLKDVNTRLAQWLLQRCPDPASPHPFRIELSTTKRVLASELGACSETLSRVIARFRAQKLLAVEGKTFTLLSPTKMAQSFGLSGGTVSSLSFASSAS